MYMQLFFITGIFVYYSSVIMCKSGAKQLVVNQSLRNFLPFPASLLHCLSSLKVKILKARSSYLCCRVIGTVRESLTCWSHQLWLSTVSSQLFLGECSSSELCGHWAGPDHTEWHLHHCRNSAYEPEKRDFTGEREWRCTLPLTILILQELKSSLALG